MKVNYSVAQQVITNTIQAKLVPLLRGSPGCGKSQLMMGIADKYKLKVIDLRLSQCDPTDLAGFPSISGNKADYIPMKHFPVEGDDIPEGYTGWLLFLDELTSASPSVQAASYKLILDRMVGSHHLHKNVVIVGAGNLETDGAITHSMSTALKSRMVHFELVLDNEQWIDWATNKEFNSVITSYLMFKPSSLYTFKPDCDNDTYASPRTWEFVNKLLKIVTLDDSNILPLLAGTISEGVAREFLMFHKLYEKLPSIKSILTKPEEQKIPTEPGILYAVTGLLVEHCTAENFPMLYKYITKLPKEFQIIVMKFGRKRHPEVSKVKEFNQWMIEVSNYIYQSK